VLVAADPRWGGGRRVEGHVAHALTGHVDAHDIVVIYTDAGGSAPEGRFPDGVREIDLAALVAGTDRAAAMRALVELVRSFRADAVVNINSRLLYDAMGVYGKALTATERVFLMMFGNEQLAMGNWVGVPIRFFYRCFDLVEGVVTDSEYLADWLRERHQLGEESGRRIHVFRAPVDPAVPVAAVPSADPARRPQVYWAGRWDRQKRLGLALEVARRMPEVDLRVWGEPVLGSGQIGATPDNVTLEGRYAHLSEVDLAEADAWLYTAAWDGVPSQLLEVAMTGVPIVSSLVGGTGEVLSDEDAWLVTDADDPDAYVAALRAVLADQDSARRRSAALRERLLRERTEAAYAEHVAAVLLHAARPEENAG
jgi:glycosyltransferase involved in cell wall biosynthesis